MVVANRDCLDSRKDEKLKAQPIIYARRLHEDSLPKRRRMSRSMTRLRSSWLNLAIKVHRKRYKCILFLSTMA